MDFNRFNHKFLSVKSRREESASLANTLAFNAREMSRLDGFSESYLCALYGTHTGEPASASQMIHRDYSALNGDPVWEKLRSGKLHTEGDREFSEQCGDFDISFPGRESFKPSCRYFQAKMVERTMTEAEYTHILNTSQEQLVKEWQEVQAKK